MSSNCLQIFDSFINSPNVKSLLINYKQLNECLELNELISCFQYFLKLKKLINSKPTQKWVKISAILSKLEKRSQQKVYGSNRLLNKKRVLVIGGGISGLRVSIELLLLGATVICVEKRDKFSRNNVIHLWPNVISDLKGLGAKRFYGKFCVGSIDHISIRQIQLILLKIALIFGLKFIPNVTFDKICPQLIKPLNNCTPNQCLCCCHSHGFGGGARAHFYSTLTGESVTELEAQSFDIIVGSDGRRNTLNNDFPRKEFRGKLAIAITANFVNHRTEAEVRVAEISGVSYIYNQKWFKSLLEETGIQLENICYYRDETHYFVMTATKQSLLARGVLIKDFSETHLLLNDSNINREQLLLYARDAAQWTSGLRGLEFARNATHSEDVALFDFTSVYAARNASRAKRVYLQCCSHDNDASNDQSVDTKYVLMLLCGDSLLEPFWPTGSGAGRGFLSALDAAWTALQWTIRVKDNNDLDEMLDVIAERESIYRLLAQTTPENINSKDFSLMPSMRYTNWRQNSKFEIKQQIKHLIGLTNTIDPSIKLSNTNSEQSMAAKRARRATVAVTTRDFNNHVTKVEDSCDSLLLKSPLEVKRVDERMRKESACLQSQQSIKSSATTISQKADWLLGTTRHTNTNADANSNTNANTNIDTGVIDSLSNRQSIPSKQKSIDILERAQQLDQILRANDKDFEPKLTKVGKIEESDWNFRVWNENSIFEPKTESKPKPILENSRDILKSRINQLESKMCEKPREVKENEKSRDWIVKMSEELEERMKRSSNSNSNELLSRSLPKTTLSLTQQPLNMLPSMSSSLSSPLRPKCVRCDADVTAMDRISISGDVLHRSCLRCSRCGISLRLNEFRNELKFLCIYCLKNENILEERQLINNNLKLKAKEMFLERVEKIDFRERIEFENKKELVNEQLNDLSDDDREEDVLSLSGTEEEEDDDDESDLNSSNGSSESNSEENVTDTDSDDEWQTQTDSSQSESEVQHRSNQNESTNNQIPSICVTNESQTNETNNNSVRYLGQFTEKLFRSRSQPMLAFNNRIFSTIKLKSNNDSNCDDSNEDLVPFADSLSDTNFSQHFSPLRGLKAPVVDFEDI